MLTHLLVSHQRTRQELIVPAFELTDDTPPILPEDYPPLSLLNHLLFCERRCALLRIEQVWVENRYTSEGSAGHRRVHDERQSCLGERRRVVCHMDLVSHRLRLVGKTDLVELDPEPRPVEYKRGKKRRWQNDDVQLCAQALCLEEMMGVPVAEGAIYHISSRRRRRVIFDQPLRARTEEAVARLHELLARGVTPLPTLGPRCRGCSLNELCMPGVGTKPDRAREYLASLYEIDLVDEKGAPP